MKAEHFKAIHRLQCSQAKHTGCNTCNLESEEVYKKKNLENTE